MVLDSSPRMRQALASVRSNIFTYMRNLNRRVRSTYARPYLYSRHPSELEDSDEADANRILLHGDAAMLLGLFRRQWMLSCIAFGDGRLLGSVTALAGPFEVTMR